MSPPVAPAHGREYSTPRSPGNVTCAWIVPLPPLTSAQANEVAGVGLDSEAITTVLILRPGHIAEYLVARREATEVHDSASPGAPRLRRRNDGQRCDRFGRSRRAPPWSARGNRPHRCPSARDRVTPDREGPRRQPSPATRERQARPVAA